MADTGWSLHIILHDYNFIGSPTQMDQSRPHRGHKPYTQGLGRFRKDHNVLSILYIKTNNSTTQGIEILVNQ